MGGDGKVRLGCDGVGGCLYIAFQVGTSDYLLYVGRVRHPRYVRSLSHTMTTQVHVHINAAQFPSLVQQCPVSARHDLWDTTLQYFNTRPVSQPRPSS